MTGQFKRGTSKDHENYIGEPGEITYNTDTNRLHVHDGVTSAGHPVALKSETTDTVDSSYSTLVTDFESDLSAWSGDTAGWSIVTSPVRNGSQAAQGDGSGVGIGSTSGLNAYPSDGATHRVYHRPGGSDARCLWTFFAQSAGSTPDGYEIFFDVDTGTFELRIRNGGSPSTLDSAAVSFPTQEYIYADASPDVGASSTINIDLFTNTDTSLASLSHDTSSDTTTFASGGVAMLSNSNAGTTASQFDWIGEL